MVKERGGKRPRTSLSILLAAIDKADAEGLRLVLKSMVVQSKDCAQAAWQELAVLPNSAHLGDMSYSSDEDGSAQEGEPRSKRARQGASGDASEDAGDADELASDNASDDASEDTLSEAGYEICRTCGTTFNIAENTEEAELCGIHEGEIEFLDTGDTKDCPWDPDRDGPFEPVKSIEEDTSGKIRKYPWTFIWTCCDGMPHDPGCVPKQHEAR